jgi:hypothetical protein
MGFSVPKDMSTYSFVTQAWLGRRLSDTDQLNAPIRNLKKKQLCFTTTSEVLSHAMLQNAENQISSELSVNYFDLAPKTASSLERCVIFPLMDLLILFP